MARKRTPKEPEDMLSLSDAARYLKITPGAITRAIERGRLVPKLVSVKQWRLTREDLDAYAKSRKPGRPPKSAK